MNKTSSGLDHVVIVVSRLEPAVRKFRGLGFTVTLGGENGPTHNALIAFKDGTYIELIALRTASARFLFKLIYRSGGLFCSGRSCIA